MSKLVETMNLREDTRARLLELRRQTAEKLRMCEVLVKELDEARAQSKREYKRLVDLTTEVAQLLHSDVAGLTPRDEYELSAQEASAA